MKEVKNGQKFGLLTVLEPLEVVVDDGGRRRQKIRCRCDCGAIHDVDIHHLLSGMIKSCGCLRHVHRETEKSHPYVGTRIYRIWGNMVNRCTNPNNPAYPNYGGRGIMVCDEWRDFKKFLKWATESGYTETLQIDRINNDDGYYPENCRWADRTTQANNTRGNRIIEFDGNIGTVAEIARIYHMNYKVLHNRLELGWDIDRAITQPVRKSGRSNTNVN